MAVVGNTGGVLGAGDEGRRTTTQEFELGTTILGDDGYLWLYVQDSGSGIAASQTDVSVDGSFQASDGLGAYVNTTAFAASEYGWVRGATIAAVP